jgi:hypothetical protein
MVSCAPCGGPLQIILVILWKSFSHPVGYLWDAVWAASRFHGQLDAPIFGLIVETIFRHGPWWLLGIHTLVPRILLLPASSAFATQVMSWGVICRPSSAPAEASHDLSFTSSLQWAWTARCMFLSRRACHNLLQLLSTHSYWLYMIVITNAQITYCNPLW